MQKIRKARRNGAVSKRWTRPRGGHISGPQGHSLGYGYINTPYVPLSILIIPAIFLFTFINYYYNKNKRNKFPSIYISPTLSLHILNTIPVFLPQLPRDPTTFLPFVSHTHRVARPFGSTTCPTT